MQKLLNNNNNTSNNTINNNININNTNHNLTNNNNINHHHHHYHHNNNNNNNNQNDNEFNVEQKKGIYHTLGVHFNSTADEIERNFNCLMRYYESLAEGQKSIEQQKKLKYAYDTLKSIKEKEKYLHELKIRSYLCQHLQNNYLQIQELKVFPFFIFQVFHESNKENITLEFNFLNQTITERESDKEKRAFLFCGISSVLFGGKENEFIFYMWDSVQVSLMAKCFYEDTKPIIRLQNPNFVESEHRHALYSAPEHNKYYSNKIYWRDRVMPPKRDKKFKAYKINTFSKQLLFIEIGISQMIIAKDEDFKRITHVIPLKKDFVQFVTKNNFMNYYKKLYDYNYEYDLFKYKQKQEIQLCLSNEEVIKLRLDKDHDMDQFLHILRRSLEINPVLIRHYYDIVDSDPSIKNGLLMQNKLEACSKYCDKISQCQNIIKKMTSRVDQLMIEEQNEIQDSRYWERNQGVIYSKLGNQKKQKQKSNNTAAGGGNGNGISQPSNNPFSSVSSNFN